MDKTWVKDVKEGERVKTLLTVARKAIPTAKSGKTYLAVTFHDKTGELEARAFDRVDELAAQFEEKDVVDVEGQVGLFQGKPQLRIEAVAKVDPATVDLAEFVWVPPPEPKKPERHAASEADEALWKELLGLLEAVVDPHVKSLMKAFVEDEDVANRLRRAAAAKTVHHAYPGGLLEHTVSCVKLAHRLADHYPQVDRDLLVAGAFFHDLGKVRELTIEKNAEYTDEGRLIGHLVMTAQWIHDKARRVGVPRDLEHHVVHMVLAHHGRLEYGSPKPPMTLEALLTHYLDEMDSRVNSWLNLMGAAGGTRRWTDSQNVYEQPIWRGTLPTVQAEKKGPQPETLTPVIYVPREGAAPQNGKKKSDRQREKRRAEPHPRPSGEAKPVEAAGEAKPEGTAAQPERPERPARPERHERPDRGSRPFGGPGDKKKGYQGPRLPGDRGPYGQPRKEKALTHNPFAALAAKLEETGKPEGEGTETEAPPPEATAAPPESAPTEAVAPEPPAEGAAESKPSEGTAT
jgi:3'-5' exoribonuclease